MLAMFIEMYIHVTLFLSLADPPPRKVNDLPETESLHLRMSLLRTFHTRTGRSEKDQEWALVLCPPRIGD